MSPVLDFRSFLREGDALIVVPPFGGLDRPSLSAHILQSCARAAGFRVSVLYASLVLGAEMGELEYESICFASTVGLLGERVFAGAAYGTSPLNGDFHLAKKYFAEKTSDEPARFPDLKKLSDGVEKWTEEVVAAIVEYDFKVVGCTTTFEQTSASIALLNRLKSVRPETITIIGGANCDGEMAEGILSLKPAIDFVFSGECEVSFPEFLGQVQSNNLPKSRIIQGKPCMDLDDVPTPNFAEFYEQFEYYLPGSKLVAGDNIWLPYEASRGCWWGQKHHCTFCGINGSTMKFREKSPDRVISELKALIEKHPSKKVCMVDNIMPYNYFRTLIPRLGDEVPDLHMFYEQKANLTLDQVAALKKAGVALIQPGVEALSTSLLRLMDKGVTGKQNLAMLRYAKSVELNVNWNLLYAFPGDRIEDYEQTLALLPLLHHLEPPDGPFHLSVDRFSPYFFAPEKYGVTNIRPMESYHSVLPVDADVQKIAYHFVADYTSAAREHSHLIERIKEEVEAWRHSWEGQDSQPPVLAISPLSSENYLLLDTRGIPGTLEVQFLTRDQAAVVLVGRGIDCQHEVQWALDRKLVVELDSWYVPLATAGPEVLREFELELRVHQRSEKLPPLVHISRAHDQIKTSHQV